MEISIAYVLYLPRASDAYGYDLQTSVVIDEDWNPLLQDFRLSKVFIACDEKPELYTNVLPDCLRCVGPDRSDTYNRKAHSRGHRARQMDGPGNL